MADVAHESPLVNELENSRPTQTTLSPGLIASLAAVPILEACGGGGGGSSSSPVSSVGGASTSTPAGSAPVASLTQSEAARFLLQAGLAASDADIQFIQANGKEAWINQQASLVPSISRVDWLVASSYDVAANMNSETGLNNVLWHHLISEPNQLVQRIALFWSEFFVVSILGLPVAWRQFMAASYMDTLEKNALGNFKDLLKAVTLSPAMGEYLSLAGSQKADTTTSRHPDENYAREVMQLFTIGLYQLNLDGSPVLGSDGQPIPTYNEADVMGLAAALTGWNFSGSNANYNYAITPMVMNENVHQSTTNNVFLGVTIPSGTTGAKSLDLIITALFNHPNVAPFVSKQMIQRLVSSNPSAAYVSRVAKIFNNNGAGVRGDLLAVVKAVLLDSEASQDVTTSIGKIREPMLRLVQWARTFNATTTTSVWGIGDTSDPSSRLNQSPMRSPTVFNYFEPNYSPPNFSLNSQKLLAPEMQIINESSAVGYLNYLQQFVTSGASDVVASYSAEIAIGANASQLIARLNLLLTANQLSSSTLNAITTSINAISSSSAASILNRVRAAVFLVMASPDYQVMR